MSTNTALDEIKAQVEGHTEGPWKAWNDAPAHRSAYVETTWAHEGDEPVQITDWCFPADAELIAAAPKLLAALEAVEAEAAALDALAEEVMGEELPAGLRLAARGIRKAIQDALA